MAKNKTNIIYVGCDQLDFTVDGTFKVGFMDICEKLQSVARENDDQQLLEFGNFKGMIQGLGGKGGWNYIINNTTATFSIKNRGEKWSLKVSVRSFILASDKYAGAIQKIVKQIKEFIAISDYRISRFDGAVDCQPDNFKIKPELFIKRGQMALGEFYKMVENGKQDVISKNEYDELVKSNTIECGRIYRKKNIETVLLGKLPNFQICLYNKSIQINKSPKFEYWRNVWRLSPLYDNTRPVWRYEFRFGRQFFKVRYINDFVDLRREIGKIIYTATRQVYMVERLTSNISRDGKTCQHWRNIRDTLFSYVNNLNDDTPKAICLKEQLQAIKARRIDRNEKVLIGLSLNIMAMNGETTLDWNKLQKSINSQLKDISSDQQKTETANKRLSKLIKEYEYLEYGVVDE